jgi:hypothetical protein
MKCSMTGQEKKWLFNTGDCLIGVMKYARLTVTLSKIVRASILQNLEEFPFKMYMQEELHAHNFEINGRTDRTEQ